MRQGIVIYTDLKVACPVRIQPVPWLLAKAQCQYLRALGIRLRRVLNRLLRAYFEDEALQAALPLSEDERAWLAHLIPNGFPQPATVFERLDTNLMAWHTQWPQGLRFLEINSVGVGCLHFMPVANQLVAEHILPTLRDAIAPTTCGLTADPRLLLRQLLEAHARAIGRKSLVVAFVERRETAPGGADEMLHTSQFLQGHGIQTVCADPRELDVRGGELVCKDTTVDLVYRDFGLSEIISIEKHGGQVNAMKHAFKCNQVISALTGEFDHKSLFELFTSPEFTRYFTSSQHRAFQAFVPWTRLLRERKTTDAAGHQIDLPSYVRRNRQELVLKPNRAYGGKDVVIGEDVTQAQWEEVLTNALLSQDTWVVQAFVPLPRIEFLDPQNINAVAKEFVTVGFIATTDGIAFIGRSSPARIVNISRGGSLVPVFLIE